MATVIAQLSMSLDGFVAASSDSVEHIFDWYSKGPATVEMPGDHRSLHVSEASAYQLRELFGSIGAVVSGRRTFDLTDGWRRGNHPAGVPVFVVTHRAPENWQSEGVPFNFVTDGVTSAIAQAKTVAGDRIVFVGSASLARQCLEESLLDELRIDLVPVLLGQGVPLFKGNTSGASKLGGPTVIEGTGVTHLHYRVGVHD